MKHLCIVALSVFAALALAAPAVAEDAAPTPPAPIPPSAQPAKPANAKPHAKKPGKQTAAPKPDAQKPDAQKSDAQKSDAQKSEAPNPAAPKPDTPKPAPAEAAQPAPAAPAKDAAAQSAPTPLHFTRAEAIKRANAFFNASPVMTADFVQIGGDGKRSEGKLHVQRAGRVRFEYAQPATMEVVADGAQVVVRDRKLNTQDLYFITQTPLKFLMKDKIDLEKDVTVQDVTTDDSGVMVFIEDKATFGGTSHVKLIFDPKSFKLKQWQITDPQGFETLISLFNIDQTRTPDPALFKIK